MAQHHVEVAQVRRHLPGTGLNRSDRGDRCSAIDEPRRSRLRLFSTQIPAADPSLDMPGRLPVPQWCSASHRCRHDCATPKSCRNLRDRCIASMGDRDHLTAALEPERVEHVAHPCTEDGSSHAGCQPVPFAVP